MSRIVRQPIGDLDQLVELQREVHVPDGLGGTKSQWTKQATVWARIRAMSGSQRQHSDVLSAEGGYHIIIRNRNDFDVKANWRAVWDGRAMNIVFPKDNGKREIYIALETKAGVAT
jgi:SPP1 family predicted phage head-tail adaptor